MTLDLALNSPPFYDFKSQGNLEGEYSSLSELTLAYFPETPLIVLLIIIIFIYLFIYLFIIHLLITI